MDVATRVFAVGVLGMALFAFGCSQSAAQRIAVGDTAPGAAAAVSGAADAGSTRERFDGSWSVEWCDRSRPDLDCGGFTATLVQQGDRVCGDFGGALMNQRQVDEGDIVGSVVGDTAVLAVESGRNGMIALVRAELRDGALHWREVDNIRPGGSDTAVIATDDLMAPTQSRRTEPPRRCTAPSGAAGES